jgi:cell division septation protein DedD
MSVRISSEHIKSAAKELLYEYKRVVIPQLGSFDALVKSSSIDTITGQFSPPSKQITFNSDNLQDDGILMGFLVKKYSLGIRETEIALEQFIDEASALLKQNEMLVFPEVGRIYRDFEGKLQFLPDKTNFHTEAFALPTVQFYPISRTQSRKTVAEPTELEVNASANGTAQSAQSAQSIVVSGAAAFAEVVKTPSGNIPESIDSVPPPSLLPELESDQPMFSWEKLIPGLLVALLVILWVTIYFYRDNKPAVIDKKDTETALQLPPNSGVDENLVNVSPGEIVPTPSETPKPKAEKTPEKYLDKNQVKTPDAQSGDVEELGQNTEATPPKKQRALVILGGFKNQENIERHRKWIAARGYELYERTTGDLSVLGCEFNYSTTREFRQIYALLKQRYGDELRVVKKR